MSSRLSSYRTLAIGALGVLWLLANAACTGCVDEVPDFDGGAIPDAAGACTAGEQGCACAAPPARCGADLACRGGRCEQCPFGSLGCPCAAGACDDDTAVCDVTEETCRERSDCEVAGCAQHQLCELPSVGDARCLESCEAGYEWVASAGRCDAIPSCDESAPGSLVDDCAAEGRVCDDSDATPQCGGCLTTHIDVDGSCVTNDCAGFDCEGRFGRVCNEGATGPVCGGCADTHVYDATTDACVDQVTCAERTCEAPTTDCIEATAGTDSSCVEPANCPAAEVQAVTGDCVSCTDCFDFSDPDAPTPRAGVLGVGNGGRAYGSFCVCELEDGWFQSLSTGTLQRCDADGDGWVTDLLSPVLAANGGNNPLAAEQRCELRTVDRFELVSDEADAANALRTVTVREIIDAYGIDEAPLLDAAGVAVVQLLEPHALDDQSAFTQRYTSSDPRMRLRPYGGAVAQGLLAPAPGDADAGTADGGDSDGGAQPGWAAHELRASEVNPLTKLCNHDGDDVNLDTVADVTQAHDAPADPFSGLPSDVRGDLLDAAPVLYRMSYFLELSRGYWRDRTEDCAAPDAGPTFGACHGAYVIAEKSRQLGPYDPMGLELAYPGSGDYWKMCVRGRHPGYPGASEDVLAINHDFSRWQEGCSESTGLCLTSNAMEHHETLHVAYDGRLLSSPALADDLTPDPPRWRGMNHQSQFRCVTHAAVPDEQAERRPPPQGRAYAMVACTLGDGALDAPPAGQDARNPWDARLGCLSVTSDPTLSEMKAESGNGQNHWIALPFERYGAPASYTGGCIDEGVEWGPFLCADLPGDNALEEHGRLFCGCDNHRGGVDCELGCAELNVRLQAGYSGATREGFWMCASPARSSSTAREGSGYSLRAAVPLGAGPSSTLCQTQDCGSGFRLSPPRLP